MTFGTSKIIKQIEYVKDNRLILVFLLSIFILFIFLNILGAPNLSFLSIRLNDSVGYISVARSLSDSGHFISNLVYPSLINTPYTRLYMPGYYIVLATAYYLFGASIFTWILPSVVSYIISAVLIYLIGNKLYNRNIAMLAALIFLLNPLIILLSLSSMSELTIVAICLSAFYVFILTPNKLKYLVFPVLISLVFLFKQNTILIAIPMLAIIMQQSDEDNSNKWLWLVNIIFTALLLFTINKWQVIEGMRPWPLIFQDLYSAKITGNGISISSVILHLGNLKYLSKYITFIFSNYVKNIIILKSCLTSYGPYTPTETYFILLTLTSSLLTLILCFVKRPFDYIALAVVVMYLIALNSCLLLYTGNLNALNRATLFAFPFIAIALANVFLSITSKLSSNSRLSAFQTKYIAAVILFLFFNVYYSVYCFKPLHQDLQQFSLDEMQREQLITNIHPNKTQLFVGPLDFCGGFVYRNYPAKFSLIPRDYDTLVLLNKKYHIDSILFTKESTTNLTTSDFTKAGFVLSQKTMLMGQEYLVFHNNAA